MCKINITKEELYDLYWNKKYSSTEIAKMFNVYHNTVLRWMKKFNIPRRSLSESIKITYVRGREPHNKNKTKDNYTPLKIVSMKRSQQKKRIKRICQTCGKVFYWPPWYGKGKYCSIRCAAEATSKRMKGSGNPNWKGGPIKYNYIRRGFGWRRIRKAILERDNYTCQRCGAKNNLTVHHILPYREFKNNEERNLVTLCRSCHQIIEHMFRRDPWYFLNCRWKPCV